MKTLRSFSLAVLAFGVLAAFPIAGHAQSVAGKFTLPHEAHWGRAVLPAGEYEVRVESVNYPARLVIQRSDRTTAALVMPATVSPANQPGTSRLDLVDTGEGAFVSAMYLKDPGVEFYFVTPRLKDTQMASSNPAGVLSAAK